MSRGGVREPTLATGIPRSAAILQTQVHGIANHPMKKDTMGGRTELEKVGLIMRPNEYEA